MKYLLPYSNKLNCAHSYFSSIFKVNSKCVSAQWYKKVDCEGRLHPSEDRLKQFHCKTEDKCLVQSLLIKLKPFSQRNLCKYVKDPLLKSQENYKLPYPIYGKEENQDMFHPIPSSKLQCSVWGKGGNRDQLLNPIASSKLPMISNINVYQVGTKDDLLYPLQVSKGQFFSYFSDSKLGSKQHLLNAQGAPLWCLYSKPGLLDPRVGTTLLQRAARRTVCSGSKAKQSKKKSKVISKDEIIRFYTDCLATSGASEENGRMMAEVMYEADYRGYTTHGINRIGMYVNDLKTCSMDGKARPSVIKQNTNTAWVDGKNGLGPVVGRFCMDLAIEKARYNDLSFVVAKGSNHYGISSFYTLMALQHGLVGLSFSNSSPLVTPTGAKEHAIGTNPLSVAVPGGDCDFFLMDMATSNAAVGKIEVAMKANKEIPLGWALDSSGKPTTNAKEAMKASSLMPMGGVETGYKGFGIALMVDIFCGILADAGFGPNIRPWMTTEVEANLAHIFICINPKSFAPCFEERVTKYLDELRGLEPVDPCRPVSVPGDGERNKMTKDQKQGGVEFAPEQIKLMTELGKKLSVKPMQPS